jgi:hypothetical protein
MPLHYIAPTPELAVELDEVRADAAALAEVFSHLNAPLPSDFPKAAVLELTSALHKLPHGTARGCLRPLNEAQSQLATIRSQYIRHDQPEEGWDIERPPLFRGEPVDQRLRGLMSSVSTALQTANRLAAEEPEPEVPEAGTTPPNDPSTAQLIERSSMAHKELEDERKDLDSLQINSEPADTLSRRLTDAVILNQLGRGELRLPRIVSARLRRIANALRDYPTLLQRGAELVTAGSHLADYAHDKWFALQHRIFHAGTTTIREVADDISNFAKKLEASRRPTEITPSEPPNDFNIDQATRLIHAGRAVPPPWRPHIETLPLGNRRIKSLSALAGLSNLRTLDKISVNANGFSTLSELTALEDLDLSSTPIVSLTPLSGLSNLRSLYLGWTSVADLTPLASLTQLRTLMLTRTSVSELSPLSQLSNIETIGLSHSPVSDLQAVQRMTSLVRLFIDSTKIQDIGPLSGLTELQLFHATGTKISDLSPISGLSNIRSLDLRDTEVHDLSPLSNLRHLNDLNLSRTNVSNLGPLAGLTNLQRLYLEKTKVSDLTPLSDMASLAYLGLEDTAASDMSPLSKLRSLEVLNLSGAPVSDLSALSGLGKIRALYLSNTRVSDLTPLSSCSQLRNLSVKGTAISRLDTLTKLPNLSSLNIANTDIEDFSSLNQCPSLMVLQIDRKTAPKIPSNLKAHISLTNE